MTNPNATPATDPENTLRGNPLHLSGRVRNPLPEPLQTMANQSESLVRQPFVGVTTDGTPERGLFELATDGPSTAPITTAAAAFLALLSPDLRGEGSFALQDENWRRWSNIAPNLMRHGVLLEKLSDQQKQSALGLLQATLSPEGYAAARGIMKLNHTIAEITGDNEQYGEWLYWLSLFGRPGHDQPWGWQIDGHHLVVNCLVVGDQLVTTPLFWGSEPVVATTGKYAGISVFRAEEALGLAMINSLTPAQQGAAVIGVDLPEEVLAGAQRDNFELRYDGVAYSDLTPAQETLLLQLIDVYVSRTRADHAATKMAEVRRHLDNTHFAWIGAVGEDAAFYYRVHSPVILIEFDHLAGIAFTNTYPTRRHIHTVVRTPNGNDYGRDLLRLHHEQAHHRAAEPPRP